MNRRRAAGIITRLTIPPSRLRRATSLYTREAFAAVPAYMMMIRSIGIVILIELSLILFMNIPSVLAFGEFSSTFTVNRIYIVIILIGKSHMLLSFSLIESDPFKFLKHLIRFFLSFFSLVSLKNIFRKIPISLPPAILQIYIVKFKFTACQSIMIQEKPRHST